MISTNITRPTGKYKHLLPLYHAFSDGGIQDNDKILGKNLNMVRKVFHG